jgi:hypothetical protein
MYPTLRAFLFEKGNSGLMLDFEAILAEITELWSSARKKTIDSERIRALITSYYPAADKITSHDSMTGIFGIAHKHLSKDFAEFVQNRTGLSG